MRNFIFSLSLFLFPFIGFTQNVGIGTSTPLQKLEVNGAIKISGTTSNEPGSIRYQNGNFEGGDGSSWKSFSGLPSKSIILARRRDTAELKQSGFEVFRESDINDFEELGVETNFAGQWSSKNASSIPPDFNGFASSEGSCYYNGHLIYFDHYIGQFFKYNIATEIWTKLPGVYPNHEIRLYHSMALAGDEIYIYGGINALTNQILSNGAKYNLNTNTWTALPDLPEGFVYHSSCFLNNQLWVAGGASNVPGSGPFILRRRLFRLDLSTNTWSVNLSDDNLMPAVYQGNAHVRNNKLVLVENTITEYDPTANKFTIIKDIDNPLSGNHKSVLVGDNLYLLAQYPFLDFAVRNQLPLITRHTKINLSTGSVDSLSACRFKQSVGSVFRVFGYNYIPELKQFYDSMLENGNGGLLGFNVFAETGSETCTFYATFNTNLIYMIKK
jgi:hypothetical protein